MTKRKTKATRGKLERALDNLDSFRYADNLTDVTNYEDRRQLAQAISIIEVIESKMYHGAT